MKLKPGMILAEGIFRERGRLQKIRFLQSSLVESLQQRRKKFIHSIGELTEKDVKLLKKLRKEGRIMFGKILVYETHPFAIFILLGYVITFLTGTDFISVVLNKILI